jgi:hypothetical protein
MVLRDLEASFARVSAERPHHKDQDLGIVACAEALEAARADLVKLWRSIEGGAA